METKAVHELFRKAVAEANRLVLEANAEGVPPKLLRMSFEEDGKTIPLTLNPHAVLRCTREEFADDIAQLLKTV